MTKYLGMDVHKTSTTIVVQREDGKEVARKTVRTRPQELKAAVQGYQEEIEVAFEESQWAAWLHGELRPYVDRIAVHRAHSDGQKTDLQDAQRLAKLVRLNEIDEVYHGSEVDTELKVLVKGYHRVVEKSVIEKGQLKSEFTSQQIDTPGDRLYDEDAREEWLRKLDGEGARRRALQCYERLALANNQKSRMKQAMTEAAKQRSGWSSVSSLPGFGAVRTATVLGLVGTPWRFPDAGKLCSYVGLAVELAESAEFDLDDHGDLIRTEQQQTRGLTDDYSRRLKETFVSATNSAIQHYEEVEQDFRARCKRKEAFKARLDIARKLVSQCWTIWRREEEYDPEKACWDRP